MCDFSDRYYTKPLEEKQAHISIFRQQICLQQQKPSADEPESVKL